MTTAHPVDDPDAYWSRRCPSCQRTNYECIAEVAEHQGVTIAEAQRMFPPPTEQPRAWTAWKENEPE